MRLMREKAGFLRGSKVLQVHLSETPRILQYNDYQPELLENITRYCRKIKKFVKSENFLISCASMIFQITFLADLPARFQKREMVALLGIISM